MLLNFTMKKNWTKRTKIPKLRLKINWSIPVSNFGKCAQGTAGADVSTFWHCTYSNLSKINCHTFSFFNDKDGSLQADISKYLCINGFLIRKV